MQVHVYPVDDLMEHELEGTGCLCGPKIDWEDGMLVIHNSLDGRELPETRPKSEGKWKVEAWD